MTNEKANVIELGDWNAIVVGESKEHGVTGAAFGLCKINERGNRLIEFCKERNLICITNTMFSQPKKEEDIHDIHGPRREEEQDIK